MAYYRLLYGTTHVFKSRVTLQVDSYMQLLWPTYAIFLDGDVAVFRNGDKYTA
jgi:hypothetical protein